MNLYENSTAEPNQFDLSTVQVRPLEECDIDAVPDWVFAIDGWEISARFLRSAYAIDPAGCLKAEVSGVGMIGMCIGINITPNLAFGGSLCVKREYRLKGVAGLLCRVRREHIGNSRLFGINSVKSRIPVNLKMGMTYPVLSCRYLEGQVLPSVAFRTLQYLVLHPETTCITQTQMYKSDISTNKSNNSPGKLESDILYLAVQPHDLKSELFAKLLKYDYHVQGGLDRSLFLETFIYSESYAHSHIDNNTSKSKIDTTNNMMSLNINPITEDSSNTGHKTDQPKPEIYIVIAYKDDWKALNSSDSTHITTVSGDVNKAQSSTTSAHSGEEASSFNQYTFYSENCKIVGYGIISIKVKSWFIGPLYADNECIATYLFLTALSKIPSSQNTTPNNEVASTTYANDEPLVRFEIVVPEDKTHTHFYNMVSGIEMTNLGDIYRMYAYPCISGSSSSTNAKNSQIGSRPCAVQSLQTRDSNTANIDRLDIPLPKYKNVFGLTHASLFLA